MMMNKLYLNKLYKYNIIYLLTIKSNGVDPISLVTFLRPYQNRNHHFDVTFVVDVVVLSVEIKHFEIDVMILLNYIFLLNMAYLAFYNDRMSLHHSLYKF